MPVASIVVPVYNRAHIVGEAIASAQAQTLDDFEMVIADDGSSDGSYEVAAAYAAADPRIRLMRLAHGGVSAARNAAIEVIGNSDFIAFLDSDDLWLPEHLRRGVEALRRSIDADVYFSRVEIEQLKGEWPEERLAAQRRQSTAPIRCASRRLGDRMHFLDSTSFLSATISNEFFPVPSGILIRKTAVHRSPWFRPDLHAHEDRELFLSLAATGCNYVFDEEVHVRMRRFGDNLCWITDLMSERGKNWLQSSIAFGELKKSYCRTSRERALVGKEIAEAAYLLAQNYAERFDLSNARSAYWKAIRHRTSYREVKGLLAAMLPIPLNRALRKVRDDRWGRT